MTSPLPPARKPSPGASAEGRLWLRSNRSDFLRPNRQREWPAAAIEGGGADAVDAVGGGAENDARVQVAATVVVFGERHTLGILDEQVWIERPGIGAHHVDHVVDVGLQSDLEDDSRHHRG